MGHNTALAAAGVNVETPKAGLKMRDTRPDLHGPRPDLLDSRPDLLDSRPDLLGSSPDLLDSCPDLLETIADVPFAKIFISLPVYFFIFSFRASIRS